MDGDAFWQCIEQYLTVDEDGEVSVDGLREALVKRGASEILAFEHALAERMTESHSWQLWGAAYLIRGGCSDDGFDYFRGWLIAQGRSVFEAALRNPESLADVTVPEIPECEDLLYVARNAYEQSAGKQMPAVPGHYPDLGEDWDFDDDGEMKSRYPRLFAIYCG